MQNDAKNDGTAAPTKSAVRMAVARWRLGSDDYLAELDVVAPPPDMMPTGEPIRTSALDNSRDLGNLVQLSLLRTKEVLELALDPEADAEDVNARSRVLLAASRVALQTQLRADANVLKRTATTAHTAMLREARELKRRLDSRTIEHVAAE